MQKAPTGNYPHEGHYAPRTSPKVGVASTSLAVVVAGFLEYRFYHYQLPRHLLAHVIMIAPQFRRLIPSETLLVPVLSQIHSNIDYTSSCCQG